MTHGIHIRVALWAGAALLLAAVPAFAEGSDSDQEKKGAGPKVSGPVMILPHQKRALSIKSQAEKLLADGPIVDEKMRAYITELRDFMGPAAEAEATRAQLARALGRYWNSTLNKLQEGQESLPLELKAFFSEVDKMVNAPNLAQTDIARLQVDNKTALNYLGVAGMVIWVFLGGVLFWLLSRQASLNREIAQLRSFVAEQTASSAPKESI